MILISSLKRFASIILSVILLTASVAFAQTGDSLSFIQMSDPQLGMKTQNADFIYESLQFTHAIEAANELKPQFVVVTGDLVNKPGDPKQIAELKRIASRLDGTIPLRWVAGNHDVGNAPTPASLRAYRQEFGRDWYSFDLKNHHFIVLNSAIFQQPQNVAEELEQQMIFLKQDLAQARECQPVMIVVMMHHPLFIETIEDGDGYVALPQAIRMTLLSLFEQYQVKLVLTGHHHSNVIRQYQGIRLITTGPVGPAMRGDVSGYRWFDLKSGSIETRYIPLAAP